MFATCNLLVEQPLSGKSFVARADNLKGIRRFPVSGAFRKHLIFYRPNDAGIEIVRVLHGSRDIEAILTQE